MPNDLYSHQRTGGGAFARGSLVITCAVATLLSMDTLGAQARPSVSAAVSEYVRVDAPVVALTHVRLMDGTGAPARDDQTVVIDGTRIAAVGPSASMQVPAGATVIDLTGHTVTPGFVGLHEHTYFNQGSRTTQMTFSGPMAYLALGITTARTAGSMFPYQELNMKRAIDRGDLAGPRLHITGPYLNGTAGAQSMNRGVGSQEEARRVVKYWAEEGATWLKLQGSLTRTIAGAIIDEAHKHGMRVTGHLCSLSFSDAAALKIDALEHGFITNSDYVAGKQPDVCPAENMRAQADIDVNSAAVQQSIRDLVSRGVGLTSTLAVYETFVKSRAHLNPRAMELLATDTRREVEATHASIGKDGFEVPERLFTKMMAWDRAFAAAGGILGAGVDPWGTGMLPGYGDLRNYEILVEAGFTAPQAIQVMSANGARILREEGEHGTVARGKRADLVVIRGDPEARASDIYNVVTVFKDGRGYDSTKMLSAIRGLVGVR